MNKKYIAPKQLVINLDATETLLADSNIASTLGEMPDVDGGNGENQFSRDNSTLWDKEW